MRIDIELNRDEPSDLHLYFTHASGTGHADSVPQSVHQDSALSSLEGEFTVFA